jgi:hypothetical protein
MTSLGTIVNPFATLNTALDDARLEAGDTIYLRAGTHTLTTDATLDTASVTLRPYGSEKAIINLNGHDLTITGDNVILRDVEIKDTPTAPRTDAGELTVSGSGAKVLNCLIHDVIQVGWWSNAPDSEINGCLLWNIGATGDLLNLRHSIYAQNTTGTKLLKNTIVVPGFSHIGINAYGSDVALVNNFTFDGVVHVGKRWQIGGNAPFDGCAVTACMTYGTLLRIGYTAETVNGDIAITDSDLSGSCNFISVGEATLTGNRLYGMAGEQFGWWTYPETHSETINNNTYEHPENQTSPWTVSGTGKTWAQWQALGYDADSTYTPSTPGTDRVVVRGNDYDDDRGMVVIYNWSQAESVEVDLSSLPLTVGRTYLLRQALDPLGDTAQFAYTEAALVVDMKAASHSVAIPAGHNVVLCDTTFPTFGAFVVERDNS